MKRNLLAAAALVLVGIWLAGTAVAYAGIAG